MVIAVVGGNESDISEDNSSESEAVESEQDTGDSESGEEITEDEEEDRPMLSRSGPKIKSANSDCFMYY